jgi:NAD(P)-dependent dehydrogenase (short-subunit alcohol dehydrogenase family)
VGQVNSGVAVVTGAARGQGRSHAEALAGEGYDIIAVDRCASIDSIPYPLATPEDLDDTAELVKSCGRRVVTAVADVRNLADLQACIDADIDELGELDVVVANAGVVAMGKPDPTDERTESGTRSRRRFPPSSARDLADRSSSSARCRGWWDAGAMAVPRPSPTPHPNTESSD